MFKAKKVRIKTLLALTSLGLLQASKTPETHAQVLPETQVAESVNIQDISDGKALSFDLSQFVQKLDQFRLSADWINQRSGEINVSVDLLADERTGHAIIDFTFANKNANPSSYRLRLYAYDHFSQVYISAVDWLLTMDYFDIAGYDPELTESLAAYQDLYLQIDQIQASGIVEKPSLKEMLLVLPDDEVLSQLSDADIYRLGSRYHLSKSRTAIPHLLFAALSNLDLQVNLDISGNKEYLTFTPKLTLNQNKGALGLSALVNPIEQGSVLAIARQETEPTTFSQLPGLKTQVLLDKLVSVDLVFDADQAAYQLTLAGLTENFNLNLFNPASSNFKTYEFETRIHVRPHNWTMPDLLTLKRITAKELTWLISRQSN
ncbi:TPA: hypothetical protein ACGO1T_000925 [Streptococcus suis]